MKPIFTLLLTAGSFTAVFAQGSRDNDNRYDEHFRNVAANNRSKEYAKSTVYNPPSPLDRGTDDRLRRQELDRINRDYDRRIDAYRNNRSLPSFERDRRIAQAEQERKEKTASFTKGAVVGAVAGVLLGVLISR